MAVKVDMHYLNNLQVMFWPSAIFDKSDQILAIRVRKKMVVLIGIILYVVPLLNFCPTVGLKAISVFYEVSILYPRLLIFRINPSPVTHLQLWFTKSKAPQAWKAIWLQPSRSRMDKVGGQNNGSIAFALRQKCHSRSAMMVKESKLQ